MTQSLFKKPIVSEDKFDRSNADNLFDAIFRVLYRYQITGKQPGKELWNADTRWSRPVLVDDIRIEWLAIVGVKDVIFPWHEDYIVDCFVALRKVKNVKKQALCNYYGLEIPQAWASSDD